MKSTLIPGAKGPPAPAVVNLRVERQRRAARRMALQTIEVLYSMRFPLTIMPRA
jgi:hypothetical protein